MWWVESTDINGAGFAKGVPVRLASAARDAVPPKRLTIHPGGYPVTVRGRGRTTATRFELSLKGVTRRRLAPGSLLYATRFEQCSQVTALFEPASEALPPGGMLAPADLPVALREPGRVPVQRWEQVGGRHLVIVMGRALPVFPRTRYNLYDRGGRLVMTLRAVLPLPPVAARDSAALVIQTVEALAAGEPVERLLYRLFGFVWFDEAGDAHDAAGPEPSAVRIGEWWVSTMVRERAAAALSRAASSGAGLRQRDATAVVSAAVPGSGPALADAVVAWATTSGGLLHKREGRYATAGETRQAQLPPAARQLRLEIERCGRNGYDIAHGIHPNTRALVERLVQLGCAVMLDNGRALSSDALDLLAQEARARISAAGQGEATDGTRPRAHGELHQRELALLWGLPRNSTRAVVARLVADGRLVRASAVHVSLPSGGHSRGSPDARNRKN